MTEQEDQQEDPIRFIYNVTPNTKILQAKSAIPAAFHYTPLSKLKSAFLQYSPLTCACEAVFNPYCPIDFNQKTIRCCICGNVTPLPPNYAQYIQPHKLPYEFIHTNTTLQFRAGQKVTNYRYSYLFVVDVNIEEKQMQAVRQQLAAVVSRLPDSDNVGLITYGRNVQVYQFSTKINTKYCINGSKQYSFAKIMELIGIAVKNEPQSHSSDVVRRFITPLDDYRNVIVSRISSLRPQNFIYVNQRKHSCFGQALSISITLAQASPLPTRIVFLVGNPCTIGPGITISSNFKQQMRSPEQLSRGQNIKYFASAKNYYDSFIKRVMAKHIILDMFIFTLNEIGFTEMSELFISSGGFVVMHEEFRDRIFRESFPKIFPDKGETSEDQKLLSSTEAVMMAYCSKQVAINGAFGQCVSLSKPKSFVSDKVVGKGKTYQWYIGSADNLKTITVIYETKQSQAKQQYYYFQIKTLYRNRNGEYITRITSVRKQWSNLNPKIIQGFDQEAAAVYLARQCVNKMLYEQQKNIRQWLDQILVKWTQNYANYIKNDETSFSLPQPMKRLPQLVFHLRRSHFVNRFGISLDESFFKGHYLNRQSVVNCLAMLQPALLSYSLKNQNTDPVAVSLDQDEMQDDVILLLDAYFVVIQWYGQSIKSWYDNGYHEAQGYEHIAELINSPKVDIDYIMKYRFPVPNYYQVHPYHSKQRYLKSRVNPKKSLGQQHQNMITDDSDLKGFTQHLIKVVVRQV